MNRCQFRRRQHGRAVALVADDFIALVQFFQQPQDAMRTGIIEGVNLNHPQLSGRAGDEVMRGDEAELGRWGRETILAGRFAAMFKAGCAVFYRGTATCSSIPTVILISPSCSPNARRCLN